MQLALAEGWTQVSPRDTPYTLLLSDQNPGQRLIAVNTAFSQPKDLGFSGGTNCPIAVDRTGERIFYSADKLTERDLRSGVERHFAIDDAFGIFWMLTYQPDPPGLVMLLHSTDPMDQRLGVLDLSTGTLDQPPLPAEAFCPLAIDHDRGLVLFPTRRGGAAVCSLAGSPTPVASIATPRSVLGGCFDGDTGRVILGGSGLHGWNTRTGTLSQLCPQGRYPVLDREGDIWFALEDGILCRLRRDGSGHDAIASLTGLDPTGWGYAQPVVFSPDGRYGLVRLTGKTPLSAEELAKAEAFCKRHGQPFREFYRYSYRPVLCILDLDRQEAWCHDGYAHNLAWIAGDWTA